MIKKQFSLDKPDEFTLSEKELKALLKYFNSLAKGGKSYDQKTI